MVAETGGIPPGGPRRGRRCLSIPLRDFFTHLAPTRRHFLVLSRATAARRWPTIHFWRPEWRVPAIARAANLHAAVRAPGALVLIRAARRTARTVRRRLGRELPRARTATARQWTGATQKPWWQDCRWGIAAKTSLTSAFRTPRSVSACERVAITSTHAVAHRCQTMAASGGGRLSQIARFPATPAAHVVPSAALAPGIHAAIQRIPCAAATGPCAATACAAHLGTCAWMEFVPRDA